MTFIFRDARLKTKMILALALMMSAHGLLTTALFLNLPQTELIGIALGGILIALPVTAQLVFGTICSPISKLTQAMTDLAAGNDCQALKQPGTDTRDEIGDLWTAFAVFRETMAAMTRLQAEQDVMKRRAEESRKEHTQTLAKRLEDVVSNNVKALQTKATQIISIAEGIGSDTTHSPSDALNVAEASSETSSNLQTVAAALEEMTSTIDGVSAQVNRASAIAATAAREVGHSDIMVKQLAEAGERIGSITKLIADIASQTHLLALNATIESARAGEAGKGFAVVAGEVKRLADQTASATSEISQQIDAIQSSTQEVVLAIHQISETVASIDQVASSISTTVSQQSAAMREISSNLHMVSVNANTVSNGVSSVSLTSAATYASAIRVIWAAEEMATPAKQLSAEIDQFLLTVNA